MEIQGFDPLSDLPGQSLEIEKQGKFNTILDEALKGTVVNILKSYTGFYDLFSEAIQNALDAVQKMKIAADDKYTPKIWIFIDLSNRTVRVTDNGTGMTEEEFLLCFRPNVSFKRADDLRGNKGVGATFLAYGYNYIQIQSKKDSRQMAAILRGGRLWAEDQTGKVPRPTLEESTFNVIELANETSGTCIEIRLTGGHGEKPKDLGWQNATTADQWFDVLRLTSPLGGIYLDTAPFHTMAILTVTDYASKETTIKSDNTTYYYPHEIQGLKAIDLRELRKAVNSIDGDPQTKFQKLQPKYRMLDCIWDIWSYEELLNDDRPLKGTFSDEQKEMMAKHQVIVYAAFLDSVKTFELFNEKLKLRKNAYVLRGGLQIACDNMPQGELLLIPLKRYTGHQFQTHVIVHFRHGSPDLGRKTIQPELRQLAEELAVSATRALTDYRWLMKPDTGELKDLTPSKELYIWKKQQEDWRAQNPLGLEGIVSNLCYSAVPKQEQDVVALYHELVGASQIKGIHFYATSQNERYDGLIYLSYTSAPSHLYDAANNRLGVRNSMHLPYESEPKVIEYKYDLDYLIADFDNGIKFADQIDLVVCWTASSSYSQKLMLSSFLIDNEGNNRIFFGSTHNAYLVSQSAKPVFEVVILEDLCNYIKDPVSEESRQRVQYSQR
ncbi:MAG: ATP-binding protein [Dehalococcoidia bacterium]|jgi:hypothetical protein